MAQNSLEMSKIGKIDMIFMLLQNDISLEFAGQMHGAIFVRFCLIFHSILTIKIEFSLDEMKKKKNQYPIRIYGKQWSSKHVARA